MNIYAAWLQLTHQLCDNGVLCTQALGCLLHIIARWLSTLSNWRMDRRCVCASSDSNEIEACYSLQRQVCCWMTLQIFASSLMANSTSRNVAACCQHYNDVVCSNSEGFCHFWRRLGGHKTTAEWQHMRIFTFTAARPNSRKHARLV